MAVEFQTVIFPSGISVIKANSCWIFRKSIAIELKSHSVKLTIAFCFLLASFFLGLPTLPLVQASLHIHDVHPSVQFSHSVVSDSMTSWTAACQASLFITNSWSLLKFMSIESVMPSNHLILCHPLLLLPSVSQHQGFFK